MAMPFEREIRNDDGEDLAVVSVEATGQRRARRQSNPKARGMNCRETAEPARAFALQAVSPGELR